MTAFVLASRGLIERLSNHSYFNGDTASAESQEQYALLECSLFLHKKWLCLSETEDIDMKC